ncbi:hypothetical protein SESBI_00607 [Sesbania bispinosa]|nr:hypothetical protein SESBI_00607 [Sesbania bispinosa]
MEEEQPPLMMVPQAAHRAANYGEVTAAVFGREKETVAHSGCAKRRAGVQLMKGRKGQGWNGGDGAAVAACAMGRLKIAMMLDDSAAVITLGDKVFLRLEQVMESCNKIGWL